MIKCWIFHDFMIFHISPMFMTSEHSLYFIGADWPWFLSTPPGYEGGKMMNMTGTWSLRFWKREGEWRSISMYIIILYKSYIYIYMCVCYICYVSYVHMLFYRCFSMRYIYIYIIIYIIIYIWPRTPKPPPDYHVYCYIYRYETYAACTYKCLYTYIYIYSHSRGDYWDIFHGWCIA